MQHCNAQTCLTVIKKRDWDRTAVSIVLYENFGQIPYKMIEKQTFPGWWPAAEEEI